MFEFDLFSLALPLAYIIVLIGSLVTFSSIYRKRKAVQSATLAPWFPPHLQRNIYLSLMEMSEQNEEAGDEKKQPVPAGVVRAALIRRAVEDIRRIIQIRTAKQALTTLLARGSIGDDLWQRFLRAEKEMEEELRDVVMEANSIAQGWGQVIFQTANEIAANTELRMKLEEIERTLPAEKEWWQKRRAAIEAELIGERQGVPVVVAGAAKKTPGPAAQGPKAVSTGDAIVDSTNQTKQKVAAKK